jgi:hypothetical protein
MRKIVLLLVLAAALVFAAAALAAETYGGPRYWYPGEGAGSSWGSGWTRNAFAKPSSRAGSSGPTTRPSSMRR